MNINMNVINKKTKELLNISNSAGLLSSMTAIALGLLVGFIVLLIASPDTAVQGFTMLLTRSSSSMRNIGNVLYSATPVMMTGLAVAFAGRTGLFNIGASWQFIVGGFFAVLVGINCSAVFPGPLLWIVAILTAMVAGAVWGCIPGILKAYRNVNEVIACIMTNYIGMYMVNYLIERFAFNRLQNTSQRVHANAILPKWGMDKIFMTDNVSSSVHIGIFIAIAAAFVMYVVLQKTKLGFELKACGFNKDAARYAGVNEKRGIITAMAISGGLAGMGGALLYLGHVGTTIHVVDVLANEGFMGIPIALLAMNHPIGVIFSSLFIAYISVGGPSLRLHQIPPEIVDMIIAIIIYFSAFALLMRGYIRRIGERKRKKTAETEG